ncbi:hypothetical protein [Arcobacter sp. LA11]|uniref:hypothetical protein n=1 Tax=Arcobacter sp. LA11 TaxID=1898176 RepID=UPI0009333C13|nr:hypothetical protein [Arcobacter sp. LA11]
MNIELRFLQKAVEDRNYISFSYDNENFSKVKPLSLKLLNDKYALNTDKRKFDFNKMSNIKILKNKF